jgi:hypothetical protein
MSGYSLDARWAEQALWQLWAGLEALEEYAQFEAIRVSLR